jgi:hypothetical protein
MNLKMIKVIGMVASGVSLVAGLTSKWSDEKIADNKITEKIEMEVAKQLEKIMDLQK